MYPRLVRAGKYMTMYPQLYKHLKTLRYMRLSKYSRANATLVHDRILRLETEYQQNYTNNAQCLLPITPIKHVQK